MSTTIDQSFVKDYESDVHEAFQRRGSFLLKTVRHKSNVVGTTTTFQKIGTGVATTKARHGTITPMNQTHEAIECTLGDFYAGDWVDRLDEAKVNHDERLVIANGGAWALGRKVDNQVLTSADATTNFVGDHTTGVTRGLLLQAGEALDANDVPRDGQRFGLLSPRQWAIAMTVNEFANADFVGDNLPFLKGAEPRTWLGIHWMVHTDVPGVTTATARCLVYHRTAIGYASAKSAGNVAGGPPVTADITWHGDRAAHFVNHMMSGGACLIDDKGVVEIRVDDTAAIP